MPNHGRNGRKPRREFVKQSVATLGAMGTLGGAEAMADAPRPGQGGRGRAPSTASHGQNRHGPSWYPAGMVCLGEGASPRLRATGPTSTTSRPFSRRCA